ncbi:MAG TPA: c-type cytochrome [Pyrinomonadaceae bacterium]|nr:c-type cytochrome [Pyrinomonadaceae bacterium]
MKLNILRVLVVALACATAVVVITNIRAQKFSGVQAQRTLAVSSFRSPRPAQTPAVTAAQQDKPTEQVQKNIKVLTGLPQWQLIPVMNYFAASMGRRCNFCHVNNQGQWDYPSDAKPEKNTAREMIKLVLDINKTTARLNLDPVACYTCHRGRNTPQSLPPLPLPVPSPPPGNQGGAGGPGAVTPGVQLQASPSPRPSPPAPDVLIQKYIDAIGGQAAIDKIKSRTATGTVAAANGMTGTYQIDQVAPDKAYEKFVTPRFTIEHAVNSTGGWEKNAQGVREIGGQELANAKVSMQLFRNLKLKEQYASMRFGGRDKIGDRNALIVIGTTPEKKRERLFFDAENGLLLRRITYMETVIGIIPDQTDFEDYRDVDGVKLPFTIRVSSVDAGNPYIVRKLAEIKLNAPVDDSKFVMPAAAKP